MRVGSIHRACKVANEVEDLPDQHEVVACPSSKGRRVWEVKQRLRVLGPKTEEEKNRSSCRMIIAWIILKSVFVFRYSLRPASVDVGTFMIND